MPRTDLTPAQESMRGRIEGLIGLAAPFLDLILAAGERLSRIAEPDDAGYYPVRRSEEGSFVGGTSAGGRDARPGGDAAAGTE